jgi:hypothetical protein
MDNVQISDSYNNILSSQTYKSYFEYNIFTFNARVRWNVTPASSYGFTLNYNSL